jgi:hypothetical protein
VSVIFFASNCNSYYLFGNSYPFGKFGSGFVLFNMFIMAYGAMVAYLLIIKDTVPTGRFIVMIGMCLCFSSKTETHMINFICSFGL